MLHRALAGETTTTGYYEHVRSSVWIATPSYSWKAPSEYEVRVIFCHSFSKLALLCCHTHLCFISPHFFQTPQRACVQWNTVHLCDSTTALLCLILDLPYRLTLMEKEEHLSTYPIYPHRCTVDNNGGAIMVVRDTVMMRSHIHNQVYVYLVAGPQTEFRAYIVRRN